MDLSSKVGDLEEVAMCLAVRAGTEACFSKPKQNKVHEILGTIGEQQCFYIS